MYAPTKSLKKKEKERFSSKLEMTRAPSLSNSRSSSSRLSAAAEMGQSTRWTYIFTPPPPPSCRFTFFSSSAKARWTRSVWPTMDLWCYSGVIFRRVCVSGQSELARWRIWQYYEIRRCPVLSRIAPPCFPCSLNDRVIVRTGSGQS